MRVGPSMGGATMITKKTYFFEHSTSGNNGSIKYLLSTVYLTTAQHCNADKLFTSADIVQLFFYDDL